MTPSAIPIRRGRPAAGRVKELLRGRLCGTIRAKDGLNVFFHARDLDVGKYNDVEVGASVSFEIIDDKISGPRAVKVRVKGPSRLAR
jgi:cold shock CspA family protein